MGAPWETIIKIYRNELGGTSFNSLQEYQENFIQFLHAKGFFCDELHQKNNLHILFNSFIAFFFNNRSIVAPATPFSNDPTIKNNEILTLVENQIDEQLVKYNSIAEICPEFITYSVDDFWAFFEETFNLIIESGFIQRGLTPTPAIVEKLKNLFYLVVIKKELTPNFTGLIFVGFGEAEIYPQLIPVFIDFCVQNKLRHFLDVNKIAKISNENPGAIRPFAQTDVIDTILSGIDPHLEKIYNNNVAKTFAKYNQLLLTTIGATNPLLTAQINAVDLEPVLREFMQMNMQTKQSNYITPLMVAISHLSKEDLAEMAESLIYLTYLKRRFTNSEESVVGPVDVAIISKGDGFVWIKRKHYFSPELNHHFFDKYFNS